MKQEKNPNDHFIIIFAIIGLIGFLSVAYGEYSVYKRVNQVEIRPSRYQTHGEMSWEAEQE